MIDRENMIQKFEEFASITEPGMPQSVTISAETVRDVLSMLKGSVSTELFLELLRKYEVADLRMISEYLYDTKAAEANLKRDVEKLKKKAGID